MRERSSVRRCWLCPVSSCTVTSCCCTDSSSVRKSPRIWTRSACCVASACCSRRTAARIVSRSAARAVSLFARSDRKALTWSSTFLTSPFRAQPATSPSVRTSVLRATEIVTTRRHFELVAPVLRPCRFVMAVHQRFFLTPGLRFDAARIDAVAHEILLRGLRPAIAEGQVVFVGPALVAVAADPDLQIGVRLQDRDLLVQRRHVVLAHGRLVEIEVNYRRERAAHLVGRARQRGQRIGLPLTPHALRFLLRRAIRGVNRVLTRPLRRGGGIRIGLRCRLRRRILAARRACDHGSAQAKREEQRYRFHPVSPIRGWKK